MSDPLDNDLYQFTMGQYAWRHHRDRSVRYRFRNRTFSVPLGGALDLDVLRRRLDEVSDTTFGPAAITALRSIGLFADDYLDYLRGLRRLPAVDVDVVDDHLILTYEGPWPESIFLETPVLAAVTQLYHERFPVTTEGDRRLDAKIRHLAANPQLRFMEFGTRRRFSRDWQRHVVERLVDEVPAAVIGTSNVALATEFGLASSGTMAHQLFMVGAAVDLAAGRDLATSAVTVLERWEAMYPTVRTLLPDTFTTAFLLPHIGRFAAWPSVRVDSGDPLLVGESILDWWRANGEDPAGHTLVFSDGLELRTMSLLHDRFGDRANVVFGWGTDLTNDLGVGSLSLVIKPDAVDGIPCVKLSDNIAKATGPRSEIQRYTALVAGAADGSRG